MAYATQIYREDATNSFIEVLNSSFCIGKVQINFIQYNENTKKQMNKLELYLDIAEMLTLCNYIISGRLDRKITVATQNGEFEGKAVNDFTSYFTVMGGTVLKTDDKVKKEKDKILNSDWIVKGKAISKQFKIMKSTKFMYMIKAEYYIAHVNEKGLIVSEGKPQIYIQIPFTERNALDFALSVQMHIQAYTSQFYNTYHEKLFSSQKCEMFESNKNKSNANANSDDQSTQENQSSPENTNNQDHQSTTMKINSVKLKSITPLTVMNNDNRDFCLQAYKSDGSTVAVIYRKQKIDSIKADVWNDFHEKTKRGNIQFTINCTSHVDGKGLERLEYVSGL